MLSGPAVGCDDAVVTATKATIPRETLDRIDLRVGRVRSARINPVARPPAIVLEIDLGPLGDRTSSARIAERYDPDALVGRRVIVLVNPPPRRVAGVRSEVLVLAVVTEDAGTVLLAPAGDARPGSAVVPV